MDTQASPCGVPVPVHAAGPVDGTAERSILGTFCVSASALDDRMFGVSASALEDRMSSRLARTFCDGPAWESLLSFLKFRLISL